MTGMEPWLIAGGAWAWQSYGKDAVSWLVKHLGKRAAEVKEAGWERVDWALAARRYREKLAELYGTMQIFGMHQPVPLGDIFTDVYLLDKPSAWRRHAIEELQARAQTQADAQATERSDGVALVKGQDRLFILGQPGAGKTTFLKFVVMQSLEGDIDAIPIVVELKAWAAAQVDLFAFLVRQFAICTFPDAQPFIERILSEGKALVLFDGLDEVNLEGGQRDRIIAQVRDFARQYGKSRVVITCRTAANEYVFEGFRYCEMADFTAAQVTTFVARWFRKDDTKRAAFMQAFEQSDHGWLRDLARRPLLLTMLCLTFEETMAFPQRRAELYEEALDALLKKWDSSRSIQRATIYRKLSLGYKRQLLMEIAAESFERGALFLPQRDLAKQIVSFVRRLPPQDSAEDVDGEAVVREIEAQHGLLVERAQAIYSFSHLTFHEYFAARYIVEHPEPEVLVGLIAHAPDAQWREVLRLTASMLDYRNVERLFDIWCRQLQRQIECDRGLTELLRWAVRQTKKSRTADGWRMRAEAMMLALVDESFVRSFDHDFDRARAFDRPFDRARDLAIAFYRARAFDLTFDRAIVHAIAFIRDLTLSFDHIGPWYLVLYDAENLAFTAPQTDEEERQEVYAALTNNLTALAQEHDAALSQELHVQLPALQAAPNEWEMFVTTMRRRLKELDIVPRWSFTEEQYNRLTTYLAHVQRFLECLDLAVVEDRDAWRARLFLPPDASLG